MIFGYIIISIYTVAVLVIFGYALTQFSLLLKFIKANKNSELEEVFNEDEFCPYVTVQLPIYNEKYVIDSLIDCIAHLDYPKDKLEIQVLDDSTDETRNLLANKIKEVQKEGIDIILLHRENRSGFKAGALKNGLASCKGDFIAIFDADFLPNKDWLKKTVPYFQDSKIGLVQTRWGHTNRNYSILTKVQAFALDAHFLIEQVGRNFDNHFINFNGTAGIWRKTCILDAGNWEGDTLTEDLDLSYRAQLKGWKFKYLMNVVSPAELPVAVSAARSQQFRWNKGGAENFKKNYFKVFQNKDLTISTKLHAFFHLLNSTMFFNIFIIALLTLPLIYIKFHYTIFNDFLFFVSIFNISTFIFFIYYGYAYLSIHGKNWKNFFRFIPMFFTFFTIAIGFSLNNTRAVIEAYLGKKTPFIRTPKFNIKNKGESWKMNSYLKNGINPFTILEGSLVLYFGFSLIYFFKSFTQHFDIGIFLFLLMVFLGFLFVFIQSIKESKH